MHLIPWLIQINTVIERQTEHADWRWNGQWYDSRLELPVPAPIPGVIRPS